MTRLSPLLVAVAMLIGPNAWAGPYPDKPVRLVVPYVAGGNLDVIGRLFAQGLGEELGQVFVVENRAGANGNVGTDHVVRSAADGYTIAMVSAGTLTINPSLYQSMPFDPEKDLVAISMVASGPMVLEVNPTLPIRNVNDLVAYAKSNPGKLNFGSGGNGTLSHLSVEMLKARTGIDVVHVPYKGTALALNDLLGGHTQAMFDTLSTSLPHIASGDLRALAVTSIKRSVSAPELPTISEAGVADYTADAWSGLVAPAKTPRDIVERLNAAAVKIAAREQIRQRLAAIGSEPVGSTPDAFATAINGERKKWAEIVKVAGAGVD